jgi:hypothetical protein
MAELNEDRPEALRTAFESAAITARACLNSSGKLPNSTDLAASSTDGVRATISQLATTGRAAMIFAPEQWLPVADPRHNPRRIAFR